MARKSNPALNAEKEQLLKSIADDQSAQKIFWPDLSLSGQVNTSYNDTSHVRNSQMGLQLLQPVYKGGSFWIRKRLSTWRLNMARHRFIKNEQNLDFRIQSLWYDLLLFEARLAEENEALDRLKTHARNTRVFFNQGKVWKNDVHQADVKVARGKKEIVSAKHQVLTTKATINQLLGRDIDAPITIDGELSWKAFEWSWTEIKKKSLENHPDLEIASLLVKVSEENQKLINAELKTNFDLAGSYELQNKLDPFESAKDNFSIALRVNWKLWDGHRTGHKRESALHAVQSAKLKHHDTRQTILLSAKRSWFSVQEAQEQVKVLEKALKHAVENYQVSQEKYRQQLGTSNDLLDSQDLLQNTRLDWLKAIKDYWQAIAALERDISVAPRFLARKKKTSSKQIIDVQLKKEP